MLGFSRPQKSFDPRSSTLPSDDETRKTPLSKRRACNDHGPRGAVVAASWG